MVAPGYVARPAKLSETAVAVAAAASTLRKVRDQMIAGKPAAGAFGALPQSAQAATASDQARDRAGHGLTTAAQATDKTSDGVEKCAIGYQHADRDVAGKYRKLLPAGPIPTLTNARQRQAAILGNLPGRIEVKPNPKARAYAYNWRTIQSRQEVTKYEKLIESAAKRHGMDPDMVKAVVWMESTHGWYDAYDPTNKTIRPMNVHAEYWRDLASRAALQDPATNIEAGVLILKGIADRVVDPTPEKIFSLYNPLDADYINGYGLTVTQYYHDKPWLAR